MYCRHCGKEIDDDNTFCPFCGKQLTVEHSAEGKDDSSKNNTLVWVIVVVVIVAIVAGLAVFLTMNEKNANNKQSADNSVNVENQTTDSEQDISQDASSDVSNDDKGQAEEKFDDSYFIIGETYYILTNLRVREGPGKNYRILSRDELTTADYAISVDSTTTNDALIKKGEVVVCQDMSGDWMRITSGWICVYDEGERLVE